MEKSLVGSDGYQLGLIVCGCNCDMLILRRLSHLTTDLVISLSLWQDLTLQFSTPKPPATGAEGCRKVLFTKLVKTPPKTDQLGSKKWPRGAMFSFPLKPLCDSTAN
ncbi:MAG: hypothetical protein ABJH63_02630 [Rhizobiaceae bacterium]